MVKSRGRGMVILREQRRSESKRRLMLEKLGSEQREHMKTIRIKGALDQLRLILADETFRKMLAAHGMDSLPDVLRPEAPNRSAIFDPSLDFLIAWRFIAPLLYDPRLGSVLEARWQRFTVELRDIFIFLVADGPFPYEERGRTRRPM